MIALVIEVKPAVQRVSRISVHEVECRDVTEANRGVKVNSKIAFSYMRGGQRQVFASAPDMVYDATASNILSISFGLPRDINHHHTDVSKRPGSPKDDVHDMSRRPNGTTVPGEYIGGKVGVVVGWTM